MLYREPISDRRSELPAEEVHRMIDADWRRAYRIRDPNWRDTYRYMMERLQHRDTVGALSDLGVEPASS